MILYVKEVKICLGDKLTFPPLTDLTSIHSLQSYLTVFKISASSSNLHSIGFLLSTGVKSLFNMAFQVLCDVKPATSQTPPCHHSPPPPKYNPTSLPNLPILVWLTLTCPLKKLGRLCSLPDKLPPSLPSSSYCRDPQCKINSLMAVSHRRRLSRGGMGQMQGFCDTAFGSFAEFKEEMAVMIHLGGFSSGKLTL